MLLLIPSPQDKAPIQIASKTPFTWNQDSLWKNLENRFITARSLSPEKRDSVVEKLCDEADLLLATYMDTVYSSESKIYDSIEHAFFQIAPLIAAQEKKSDWHLRYYNTVRQKL